MPTYESRKSPPASERSLVSATEAELVRAIRRGESRGVSELISRFTSLLLVQGRRLGLSRAEAEECAQEAMEDAVMVLLDLHSTPRALASYLVCTFRHRVFRTRRVAKSRAAHEVAASAESNGGYVVRELCSETALRASDGPDVIDVPISPTVSGMAAALVRLLSPDEELLLSWVSNGVSEGQIGEWLGVRPDTAGKRTRRLRARCRDFLERYAERLPEDEQLELRRFLRRANTGDSPSTMLRANNGPLHDRGQRSHSKQSVVR